MAAHIDSVAAACNRATVPLPRVTKAEFYRRLCAGDLVFCSGREAVSSVIERETFSPWSHVLMAWIPGAWAGQWLTLEATFGRGVHVGLLSDYIDHYDGEIVMARRPALTQQWIDAELDRGFSLLDDGYDWKQEVSIAARKLLKSLPLLQPRDELYCSGLQYAMSLATPYPLKRPLASYPTPEDNWTDPSVEAVCALAAAS